MGTGTGASLLGILPLIAAGFIFNGIFYITRFRLAKADGQRLFFSCVISGFAIGLCAFIARAAIRSRIEPASRVHELMDWLHGALPIPFGMTYLFAILLAIGTALFLNALLVVYKWIVARKDPRRISVWVYWKNMSENVTAFDELLRRAVFEDALVLLCLKSRKVYCGVVSDITGKHQSAIAHVQLIPTFSITRDKDTLRFMPETRTEYRAYGLKLAFDRMTTLDRLIRSFVQVYKTVADSEKQARKSRGGVHKRAADLMHSHLMTVGRTVLRPFGLRLALNEDGDFKEELKIHIRELLAERRQLRELLLPYLQGGRFDVSVWAKVIPVTEIESASLYKAGSYEKWFASAEEHQGKEEMVLSEEISG